MLLKVTTFLQFAARQHCNVIEIFDHFNILTEVLCQSVSVLKYFSSGKMTSWLTDHEWMLAIGTFVHQKNNAVFI